VPRSPRHRAQVAPLVHADLHASGPAGRPMLLRAQSGNGGCGRPFSVGEELRIASGVARDDWAAFELAPAFDLDEGLLADLADEWRQDAVFEHASIASFARLTLELLALGAPAELVRFPASVAGRDRTCSPLLHVRESLCWPCNGPGPAVERRRARSGIEPRETRHRSGARGLHRGNAGGVGGRRAAGRCARAVCSRRARMHRPGRGAARTALVGHRSLGDFVRRRRCAKERCSCIRSSDE
jgi:hypothetical protein